MKFTTKADVQRQIRIWKKLYKSVALVPTMGALHEGHLSLVRKAQSVAERVVVSIFVNPTQFNNADDLSKYPRTEEADLALLRELGVHAVFTPAVAEIYPGDTQTVVSVPELAAPWEGAGRAGHFEGVATIVSILFHMLTPDVALFGEKDFQQLRIIEQLTTDLHLPVKIIRGELIRDKSGLALSSRNERLSDVGRKTALSLHESLLTIQELYRAGTSDVDTLLAAGTKILADTDGLTTDYLAIVEESTLAPAKELCGNTYRTLVCGYVEDVRLLDNMRL